MDGVGELVIGHLIIPRAAGSSAYETDPRRGAAQGAAEQTRAIPPRFPGPFLVEPVSTQLIRARPVVRISRDTDTRQIGVARYRWLRWSKNEGSAGTRPAGETPPPHLPSSLTFAEVAT